MFHNHWSILLLLVLVQSPSTSNGFFFRCPGSERCLLGFFVVMHSGTPDTDQCIESCVFFRDPSLECGSCSTSTGNADVPTVSPAPIPNIPPTASLSLYDINVEFNNIPSSDEKFFTSSIGRWESIIMGDVPDASTVTFDPIPGCSFPAIVDDLYICSQYADIDGEFNVILMSCKCT